MGSHTMGRRPAAGTRQCVASCLRAPKRKVNASGRSRDQRARRQRSHMDSCLCTLTLTLIVSTPEWPLDALRRQSQSQSRRCGCRLVSPQPHVHELFSAARQRQHRRAHEGWWSRLAARAHVTVTALERRSWSPSSAAPRAPLGEWPRNYELVY